MDGILPLDEESHDLLQDALDILSSKVLTSFFLVLKSVLIFKKKFQLHIQHVLAFFFQTLRLL